MNILQINNHEKIIGGSETVYLGEKKQLENMGHKVYSISTGISDFKNNSQLIIKKRENLWNPFSFIFSFRVFFKSLLFLRNKKIDIAHIHIYYGRLTNAILLALKFYNIPVVQSVHEYRLLCPTYKLLDGNSKVCELCSSNGRHNLIKKKCVKDSFLKSFVVYVETIFRDFFVPPKKYINEFIYVSKFIRSIHVKYGFSNGNLLYNFSKISNASNDNHNLEWDFISLGRLSKEKGLDEFLTKLNIYSNQSCLVVGDGPELSNLKNKFFNNKNIKFLGRVSHNKVSGFMKKAKFLVVPSIWYENNPMTVLEAFSESKPVVSTRLGGLTELVIDNKTGFLFDINDDNEIKELFDKTSNISKVDYDVMCQNSKEFHSEIFTESIHSKNLEKIYLKVLNNSV